MGGRDGLPHFLMKGSWVVWREGGGVQAAARRLPPSLSNDHVTSTASGYTITNAASGVRGDLSP